MLHTIFFHRALGAVRPIEKDCELFDVTFVQCNDAAVDQHIAGAASQYEAWAAGHPGKQGQVSVNCEAYILLSYALQAAVPTHCQAAVAPD